MSIDTQIAGHAARQRPGEAGLTLPGVSTSPPETAFAGDEGAGGGLPTPPSASMASDAGAHDPAALAGVHDRPLASASLSEKTEAICLLVQAKAFRALAIAVDETILRDTLAKEARQVLGGLSSSLYAAATSLEDQVRKVAEELAPDRPWPASGRLL